MTATISYNVGAFLFLTGAVFWFHLGMVLFVHWSNKACNYFMEQECDLINHYLKHYNNHRVIEGPVVKGNTERLDRERVFNYVNLKKRIKGPNNTV